MELTQPLLDNDKAKEVGAKSSISASSKDDRVNSLRSCQRHGLETEIMQKHTQLSADTSFELLPNQTRHSIHSFSLGSKVNLRGLEKHVMKTREKAQTKLLNGDLLQITSGFFESVRAPSSPQKSIFKSLHRAYEPLPTASTEGTESGNQHQGDEREAVSTIFVFEWGGIVTWGMNLPQVEMIFEEFGQFTNAVSKLTGSLEIRDSYFFQMQSVDGIRWKDDVLVLPLHESQSVEQYEEHLMNLKAAVSHGVALCSRLSSLETIALTVLKRTGNLRSRLTRSIHRPGLPLQTGAITESLVECMDARSVIDLDPCVQRAAGMQFGSLVSLTPQLLWDRPLIEETAFLLTSQYLGTGPTLARLLHLSGVLSETGALFSHALDQVRWSRTGRTIWVTIAVVLVATIVDIIAIHYWGNPQ